MSLILFRHGILLKHVWHLFLEAENLRLQYTQPENNKTTFQESNRVEFVGKRFLKLSYSWWLVFCCINWCISEKLLEYCVISLFSSTLNNPLIKQKARTSFIWVYCNINSNCISNLPQNNYTLFVLLKKEVLVLWYDSQISLQEWETYSLRYWGWC